MARHIFVDCDDTLVLWPETGTGLGAQYELNMELIADIDCFLHGHEYALVVWSGGGVQYAMRWARLPELCTEAAQERAFGAEPWVLDKNMKTPQAGDIVIDDMWEEMRYLEKRGVILRSPEQSLTPCPVCDRGV